MKEDWLKTLSSSTRKKVHKWCKKQLIFREKSLVLADCSLYTFSMSMSKLKEEEWCMDMYQYCKISLSQVKRHNLFLSLHLFVIYQANELNQKTPKNVRNKIQIKYFSNWVKIAIFLQTVLCTVLFTVLLL